MPIRASVLRRPASKAATRFAIGLGRRHVLGAARAGQLGGQLDREPRMDGRRADGERHRHRVDVEDVGRIDDEVGPAAQARLGQRGVDGAGARIDGTGSRSTDSRASLTTRTSTPRRRRADGVRAEPRRARPPARPARPTPARSRRARGIGAPAARSARRQAGRGRRRSAAPGGASGGPRGGPPSSAGRRPSSTRRSMTTRSRSGSMAGFVTWANAWRRWSATGRSRRPRPAVGVSSPMLHSGSCASRAIVLMSRRAFSASSPAR